MDWIIRPERPGDHYLVEMLIRDAFWDVYRPGCHEHYLAHCLRKHPDFEPELNFVATDGTKIVGSIMFSRARIVGARGFGTVVLCLGPLAVRPDYQRQGVGSALIRHALRQASELGYAAAFLFGSGAYYPRFGFRQADAFGITTADGENPPAFMGVEIYPGALREIGGRFYESSVFRVEREAVEAFDGGFPPRKKHRLPTQLFAE